MRFVRDVYVSRNAISRKKKKKKTIDSSDGEKLSSRNFSLPERDNEFLKIINNRPGGRGRIFNFDASFFPSPREEEAAATRTAGADRLEIRRYKDTALMTGKSRTPQGREVDLKDRCLRYRCGTKKPCGLENRLKHREASHNLARQKDRASVLPREWSGERKTRWKKNAGRKKRELFGGGGIRRGKERLSPWIVPAQKREYS